MKLPAWVKRAAAPVVLRLEALYYRCVVVARRPWRSDQTEETDLCAFLSDATPGRLSVITPAGVPVSGQRRLQAVRIGRGALTCEVRGEALFVPVPKGATTFTHNGLYDTAGALIGESCVYRDVEGSERVTIDQGGHLPGDADSSDEAVIYLGILVSHYGHFLTESIARLWYALDERPDLPVLYHGAGAMAAPHVRRFFEALDIPRQRLVAPTRPTRFREVHIPQPTFIERFMLHERHLAATRRAAVRILDGRHPPPSQQPLYLSRARLGVHPRALHGEAALVRHLRRAGVRVVDPQALDFDEQVRLFNQHEVIIGPIGSAHHTTALSLAPRHHIYLCNWASQNFVLFDMLTGNRAHYLQLTPDAPSLQSKPNHLLDVPLTLSVLRDLGVIAADTPGARDRR